MTTLRRRGLIISSIKKASLRRTHHRCGISTNIKSGEVTPRRSPSLQRRKLLINWLKDN
jgi:hypothetical protein